MSIFSTLFGGANANTAPAQPTPGNIPTNVTQPNPTNPTVPAGNPPAPTTPTEPTPPTNPMDNFSDLWKPVEVDPKNPNPDNQPIISVDPKALAEAARKTDFSKMITPEHMQAIAQGGEAAQQAFAQAMNAVAQGVYAQSAFASTKIVEQALAKAQERFESSIPSHVKKLQVSENLRSENPALSHPAAAPILGALESQFTMKHPNASSTEISKMAKDYLEQFAGAVNAPKLEAEKLAQQKDQGKGTTDWTSFL